MIDKQRIAHNAGSSVAQVIISGFTTFLLFRYLLEIIGPEELGVWVLVLSAGSMVQAANLGMTGSIVKHIADYDALGDKGKISLATQTAVISIAVFGAVFISVLFPLAEYYFEYTLDAQFYSDALEIIPLALSAFWVYMLSGIYLGALYGCQMIIQRNGVLVFDSISHFGLCVLLAPSHGLVGLAYARVIQNCLTLGVSIILLKRHVRVMPIIPLRWRKRIFKEMLGYAVNFQIIAILVMLSDPITKGFLSKYGNITMVTYYEMANKLVQLFRALLVSANQVLVPAFARLNQLDPEKISVTYLASYRLIFYLAVPGFSMLAISAPLISGVWIGYTETVFIISMVLLCFGWLANVLSVPAYYADMGIGNMKHNVIVHVFTTAINLILILIIGDLLDGLGVVVAWVVALILGGALLNILYYMRNKILFSNIIPEYSRWLVLFCLIGIFIGYGIWLQEPVMLESLLMMIAPSYVDASRITDGLMIASFIIIVGFPMWRHPMRKTLLNLVVKRQG